MDQEPGLGKLSPDGGGMDKRVSRTEAASGSLYNYPGTGQTRLAPVGQMNIWVLFRGTAKQHPDIQNTESITAIVAVGRVPQAA